MVRFLSKGRDSKTVSEPCEGERSVRGENQNFSELWPKGDEDRRGEDVRGVLMSMRLAGVLKV